MCAESASGTSAKDMAVRRAPLQQDGGKARVTARRLVDGALGGLAECGEAGEDKISMYLRYCWG